MKKQSPPKGGFLLLTSFKIALDKKANIVYTLLIEIENRKKRKRK